MTLSNCSPRYLPKRNENTCPHKFLNVNVHSNIFIVVRLWKQCNVHQLVRIDKVIWVICLYIHTMVHCSSIKRNEILIRTQQE